MPHRTHVTTLSPGLPAKKRSNRKRRRWARVVTRLGIFVIALEVLWFIFVSPLFRVTHVEIDGLQTIPESRIVHEAAIHSGRNLFITWLTDHIRERVSKDPVIDNAEVLIALPHTIIVRVEERQPYLQLRTPDGLWLMDYKRVPYRSLDSAVPGVPVLQLSGDPNQNLVVFGKPNSQYWLVSGIDLLHRVKDQSALHVGSIKVDQNANLCLNSKNQFQIKFGQPEMLDLKIAVAVKALEADGGRIAQDALYVDVSSPHQPVWRPRPKGITGTTSNGSLSGQ